MLIGNFLGDMASVCTCFETKIRSWLNLAVRMYKMAFYAARFPIFETYLKGNIGRVEEKRGIPFSNEKNLQRTLQRESGGRLDLNIANLYVFRD